MVSLDTLSTITCIIYTLGKTEAYIHETKELTFFKAVHTHIIFQWALPFMFIYTVGGGGECLSRHWYPPCMGLCKQVQTPLHLEKIRSEDVTLHTCNVSIVTHSPSLLASTLDATQLVK